MKVAAIGLCLLLLAGASCHALDRSPLSVTTAIKADQKNQVLALTEKEEQNFSSLTRSQILWFLNWQHPEIACRYGRINIATNYQQLAGQEIDLKLVITRKFVFSYFAQLHFRIVFLRDAELGLTSTELQPFCQSTNDEAISWFKPSDEPLLGDEPIYQENRKYLVPPQSEEAIEYPERWGSEKQVLYEKLSQAISDDLRKIGCRPNQVLNVTIPHFNLTYSRIYFFVSSGTPKDEFLGWAIVSRDRQGEYKVTVASKRFYIADNPQAIDQFFEQALSEKIRRLRVAEIMVNCPQK